MWENRRGDEKAGKFIYFNLYVANSCGPAYIRETNLMKKLILVALLVLLLFNISCIPERNCCVLPNPDTHVAAQKNGVLWSTFAAKGSLSNIDSLSLSASTTKDDINKLDSLNIKIAYNDKGTYPLQGNQAFYATFANGVKTTFKLDPAYNNVLTITTVQHIDNPATTNPNQVRITGTFSIKFIDPKNPDGITFTNGDFYALMNR
jgi:hypothetical protein